MPTLIAQHCSPELATRVRAYARQHPDRSSSESLAALITLGLDSLDARTAGGRATQAGRTATERSASGRHAAQARWRTASP